MRALGICPVAGGGGTNAASEYARVAGKPQPAGGRARGNRQRLSVHGLTPDLQREGPLTQVDAIYVAELILRAKASRLLAHVFYQFWPLDSFWKTGEIFYQCGE